MSIAKKALGSRKFKKYHYEVRTELWAIDGVEDPCVMKSYYSLDTGAYIGAKKMALFLCRERGLVDIQKRQPNHCVASIGFDPAKQEWSGWSHRALCTFGIGDKFFDPDFGDEHTLYKEHGGITIETLEQAKESARAFAADVS